MRPELELVEKIEQWLKGELTGADKAAFEKQIANDPALQEEIRLQQDLVKGIERAHLKTQIQTAKRSFNRGRNFTRWGLGGLTVAVIAVAAFLFYKSNATHNAYEGNLLPEYNEQGEKLWADADKNIPAQSFSIDNSTDTVIETKAGIVMAIPAHGFLDENGNPADGKIELVVKEALDPAAILSAGLSTKSGGELLESGGMFFIDARKNGKPLKIDPANGIYTEIPANGIKEGMRLFTGKRMPGGTIDWIDPRPLEHDLVPVDIEALNFYPPNYLDSLQQWGYDIRNKQFTDSLYYSFAALFAPKADSTTSPQSRPVNEGEASTYDYIQTDTMSENTDRFFHYKICGINPAKIKTIWNEKFQNTFIATREFEERLRVIHLIAEPLILDLYINNLDKNLSAIDSIAASGWHEGNEAYKIFMSFASRHDGKVKNSNKQFDMLKNYYSNKTKAFTEAMAKTQNEFWNKQAELDNEAAGKNAAHESDSAIRIAQNFQEEFSLNLKEAYRQLGYKFDSVIRPVNSTTVYRTQVIATGWCNVDRYVFESTLTRTTLDYTDPGTGKKAIIKYLPVSVQIEQWNEYDRLYVYLLPDKLSSFMRVSGTEGKFSEKLDELMQYGLVCIGYKDEQAYYYSQQTIQSKDYTGIALTSVNKEELDIKLKAIGNLNQSPALLKENDFFLYDIKDQERQKHNLAIKELRDKVIRVIFSCYGETQTIAGLPLSHAK